MKTNNLHLAKKYEDDIVVSTSANKISVFYFKNTGHMIITDVYYQQYSQSLQLHIVLTSSMIVVEDILSQVFKFVQYNPNIATVNKKDYNWWLKLMHCYYTGFSHPMMRF